MPLSPSRLPALRHLGLTLVAVVCGLVAMAASGLVAAQGSDFPAATPRGSCGPGSLPETGVQGRVPASDYASGRARRGYRCNVEVVYHRPGTGGFKVHRYRDRSGHTCAYFDTTKTFPTDLFQQAETGFGVVVLDLTKPRRPRVATTLVSPTMLSPHETLNLHAGRGLLAAVMGTAITAPGFLEIYDLRDDCRRPRLLSRTLAGVLGHESGWSPDGRTFYSASSTGQTLTAVDVSNPRTPQVLFVEPGVNYHGVRISDDGRTAYVANIGNDLSAGTLPGEGMRIIDVSEIQERRADPDIRTLSNVVWQEGSIPQVAQPFNRDGRSFVLEVDEFSRFGINNGSVEPAKAVVGAARIIDVTDPRRARVVSHLRLGVQQPKARIAAAGDPGADSPLGGYTAHYCSLPYRDEPRLAACSMIGSGLRIFDISDLSRPREVAYFNAPGASGSSAYSEPAWDVSRRQVWYTDTESGFYALRLTNGVGRLLARER